ncbi:unnamed protein product [Ambrosiozyma monospora]|uniref:Unnamed protein product n=1 Tax=Ambrosiozyma monospora TaxID=43982 RepID=A0ACB5T947_AMBMO|nr:unnamed protein product [Ambrosiozyma monospora]
MLSSRTIARSTTTILKQSRTLVPTLTTTGRLLLLPQQFQTQTIRRTYATPKKGTISHFAPPPSYESNKKTETNRLEKTLTKFWEKVSAQQDPVSGSYHIKLDKQTIKTPLGYNLTIPKNKAALAHLLVVEWQSLPDLAIKPYLVPLTSLVSRCIDLEMVQGKAQKQSQAGEKLEEGDEGVTVPVDEKEREMIAKIGGDLNAIKTQLLRYLDTDTLLVFAPEKDCDGELRKRQEETYRPIIESMEKYLSKFSSDGQPLKLSFLDSDKDGMRGNSQPAEVRAAALNYLNSLDIWSLVALEKATLIGKSFLTGVSLLRMCDVDDSYDVGLEEIATAATLETVVQTGIWGEVEDTHDVDKVDVRRSLAAASIVAYNHGA